MFIDVYVGMVYGEKSNHLFVKGNHASHTCRVFGFLKNKLENVWVKCDQYNAIGYPQNTEKTKQFW